MSSFLETAIKAAKSAGDLLKEHYYKDKEVDSYEQYDIKLELDVMSQNLISEVILNDFPDHSIIGEEGDSLSNNSEYHWSSTRSMGQLTIFMAYLIFVFLLP